MTRLADAAVARGPAGQAGRRRCRRRSATLAGLFAAPLRNLGYALQQVAEQKASERRLSAPIPDPTTATRPTPEGDT